MRYGEIGDFAEVPILTDHRMRPNTMFMATGDINWFTDRSMVRDDCDCSYCKWQPPIVEMVPRDGYDYPTTLRPLCEGAPDRGQRPPIVPLMSAKEKS